MQLCVCTGEYVNPLFTQVIGEGLEAKWWVILFNTMTAKNFLNFLSSVSLRSSTEGFGISQHILRDTKVGRCGRFIFQGLAWHPEWHMTLSVNKTPGQKIPTHPNNKTKNSPRGLEKSGYFIR